MANKTSLNYSRTPAPLNNPPPPETPTVIVELKVSIPHPSPQQMNSRTSDVPYTHAWEQQK